MNTELIFTLGLGLLGVGQTAYLYARRRHETIVEHVREAEVNRVNKIETELSDHVREDREMHERLQKVETRVDGVDRNLHDINSRHGELVGRLDKIHNEMLTKDDFKLLLEVLRKP